MFQSFANLYLKHDLKDQIKNLYTSIAIRDFAVSMIEIFEPIYIYKIYGSLQIVILFYVAMYFVYFFTIPLGAKAAAKYGFGHCISASVFFVVLYYLVLSQIKNFPILLVLALLLTVADKTFMRPAYHASMANYGKRGFRGREIGGLSFIETIAKMSGPLLGGIILTVMGFNFLFLTVALLAGLSTIPLLAGKEESASKSFSYRQAMKRFLAPNGRYKRNDSFAFMGYGEELVVASFWPIFIFLFLPQFHTIGLLATAASIFVALTKLYFGKLSDIFKAEGKKRLVDLSAWFYALTNVARPFANNWPGIFSINFSSDTLKGGIVYPFFTYVYSAAGENKDFLEYGVFYEMSLAFGKIAIGAIIFALSLYLVGFNFWFIIFLLAGVWSTLYTRLKF